MGCGLRCCRPLVFSSLRGTKQSLCFLCVLCGKTGYGLRVTVCRPLVLSSCRFLGVLCGKMGCGFRVTSYVIALLRIGFIYSELQ